MNTAAIEERTLGPEWDTELFTRLRSAVLAARGTMTEASYAVAGSQEVITYDISLPDGRLTATCETFVGLSIKGPGHLVKQLDHVGVA